MNKQSAFLSAILISFNALAQMISGIPTGNLVSAWTFSGNATNLITGTSPLNNTAQLTTNRFSQANSAYYFDSYFSQIEFPQENYNIPYSDFSLSYWFRTEYELTMYPFNIPDSNLFISNFNMALNSNYDGTCTFWNGPGNISISTDVLGQYSDNNWHNIIFIQEDSTFTVFIDGKFKSSITDNQARIDINRIITLSHSGLPFYGELDDVLIYDKAINMNEIRQIVDADVSSVRIVTHKNTDAYQPGITSRIGWFKPFGTDSVKLEYSVNNGTTWNLIADHLPARDYFYDWPVPNLPESDCILKISDCNNSTISATSPVFRISKYQWQNLNLNNAFGARDGSGAYVFKDSLHLVGGWTDLDQANYPNFTNNEVWTSGDGINWTQKPNAPWEERHTFGDLVYNNQMWVVGGDQLQNHFQQDVWSSPDGVNWNLKTANAPWGERMTHISCVFDNKMWVMGGQKIIGWNNTIDTVYNDVWNSTDGINWTLVTNSAPWNPRGQIEGDIVFNNKMWIIGGGTYNGNRQYFNDVWNSSDGLNWTLVSPQAPWTKRQYLEVMAYDNAMWVIGGYDGIDNRKDVWYSKDGITWLELKNSPFPPRHASSVFNYKHSLWVVAGNLWNDSWKLNTLVCPVITSQPANTTGYSTQNAVFSTGYSAAATLYQWQLYNVSGSNWIHLTTGQKYSGVNTPLLTIHNLNNTDQNTSYRCLFTSGACSDTSDIVQLKVIDATGVIDHKLNNSVYIYPNPADNSVVLSYPDDSDIEIIRLLNVQGKELMAVEALPRETTLDISHLPDGIYLLELHGKNYRTTKKLAKH